MRKTEQIAISSLFLAVLSMPWLASLCGWNAQSIENRALGSFPSLSFESVMNLKFFDGLTSYLTDHFPFRAKAVNLTATIRHDLFADKFGQARTNKLASVIFGRSGWMFIFYDIQTFSDEKIAATVGNLKKFESIAQQRGIDFRIALAPNKAAVYPEHFNKDLNHLLEVPRKNSDTLDKMLGDAGIRGYVNLRRVIQERKQDWTGLPLYYRTDDHWSEWGLAVAGEALVDSIQPGLWDWGSLKVKLRKQYKGNLNLMLGLNREETIELIELNRPGIIVLEAPKNTPFTPAEPTKRFRHGGPEGSLIKGRTYIIIDSFFDQNINLIAPYFEDVTFLLWNVLEGKDFSSLIESPDRYILTSGERGIHGVRSAPPWN